MNIDKRLFVIPLAVLAISILSFSASIAIGAKTDDEKMVLAGIEDKTYRSELSGNNEVPKVNTAARGMIELRQEKGDDDISFVLTAENISNVTQAHIHMGKPGENGPVVVALLSGGGSGSSEMMSGELASGKIGSGNLTGPLAGKTLSDLKREIENGNAYVNVHTQQNPNGEIRGQLMK